MESQTTFTAKTVILLQNLDSGLPTPEIFKIEESQVDVSNVTEGGLLV